MSAGATFLDPKMEISHHFHADKRGTGKMDTVIAIIKIAKSIG